MAEQMFSVIRDPRERAKLVRRVVPDKGEEYEHRCPLETFEALAMRIDEVGDRAFYAADLIRQLPKLPDSAAYAALEFMVQLGILDRKGRQLQAVMDNVHMEAMIEFWALLEEPEADPEQFTRNAAVLPIEVNHG